MGSIASFPNSSTMSHRLGHVLNTSAKQSLNAHGQLSWSDALLSSAKTRESVLLRQTLQSRNVKSLAMGHLVRRTLHSLRTIAVNFASNFKDHSQNAKWRQLSRSSEATAGNAKESNEKASSNRGLGYLEPLPEPLHAVLPPETIGNGRVIIVGDIHGTNLINTYGKWKRNHVFLSHSFDWTGLGIKCKCDITPPDPLFLLIVTVQPLLSHKILFMIIES